MQAVALEHEDAAGGGYSGLGESQLAGHGYLQVGGGAAAQLDVGEAGDGQGEYLDVVLSGKGVAGGADGLCGEECGGVVAAHENGVDGQLEGNAAVFVVQGEGALRSRHLKQGVAAGFEVSVGVVDGWDGVDGDVVGEEGVDFECVDGVFGVVVVEDGVAECVCLVVVEGDGDVGLVGAVVLVNEGEGEECVLVGEEEDLVQGLVETFLVAEHSEVTGAVGLLLEVVGTAYADDEGLDDSAALLNTLSHIAEVAVGVVHAVGDDEDDVAGVVVFGEVFERAVEGGGCGAPAVGYEGFEFAFQLVGVVGRKGHFELGGDGVFVEVAEDAQSHFHVGMALDAVEKAQQYLLGDFNLRVALPFVPHALRAVENNEHTGGFLTGCVLGWQAPCR